MVFEALCNLFVFDDVAGWISRGSGRVIIKDYQLCVANVVSGERLILLNHLISNDIQLLKSKDNECAWVYKAINVKEHEEEEIVVAVELRDLKTALQFEDTFYKEMQLFLRPVSNNGDPDILPVDHCIKSFASFSLDGFIFRSRKVNQDALLTTLDEASGALLLATFDGHGPSGEVVSGYLRDNIAVTLFQHKDFPRDIGSALRDSIRIVEQNMLKTCVGLNALSGSTAVVCVVYQSRLTIANVGDSRIVLGSASINTPEAALIGEVLTVDHKPNDPSEKARILRSGGSVSIPDPSDPACPSRVYVKNESLPGLAMSRSVGDIMGKSAGVISVPDITTRALTDLDEVIIIGSDGVWDFMPASEAVNIAKNSKGDAGAAAKAIVTRSQLRWRAAEPTYIDDVSVIVAFINSSFLGPISL